MSLKQRLTKLLGLTDKVQATSVCEIALMQSNGIKGDDSKQSSISLLLLFTQNSNAEKVET